MDLANVAAGPAAGVVFVACMGMCSDPASKPDRGVSCRDISGVAIKREKISLQIPLYTQLNGRVKVQIQYSL